MPMNRTAATIVVTLRMDIAVSILVRLHAYRQNSSTNVGEIANGQNRNKRLHDIAYGQLETTANVFGDTAKGQLETAAEVLATLRTDSWRQQLTSLVTLRKDSWRRQQASCSSRLRKEKCVSPSTGSRINQ